MKTNLIEENPMSNYQAAIAVKAEASAPPPIEDRLSTGLGN